MFWTVIVSNEDSSDINGDVFLGHSEHDPDPLPKRFQALTSQLETYADTC